MALIAHYPLISDAKDIGRYSNHGTVAGAQFGNDTNNKTGGYLQFGLDTDKLTIPHTQVMSEKIFGTSNICTLSIWACPSSLESYGVLGAKAINGSYSNTTVGIWQEGGGFRAIYGANVSSNPTGSYISITYAATSITLNTWYHLCLVLDGINMLFYVNGILQGTVALSGVTQTRSQNTSPITIGPRISTMADSKLRGKYSDLRIYDHALTASDVRDVSLGKLVHYTFNQNDTVIRDTSGFGKDAASNSGTFTDDGIMGKRCINFTDTQNLKLPETYSFLQQYTLSVWINLSQLNDGVNNSYRPIVTSSLGHLLIAEIDGTISFRAKPGASTPIFYRSSSIITTNKWFHVAVTYDQNIAKIYVNGQLIGSNTIGVQTIDLAELYLTQNTSAAAYNKFVGKMDDFRLYSTALNDQDITNIYQDRINVRDSGDLKIGGFISPYIFNHKFITQPFTVSGLEVITGGTDFPYQHSFKTLATTNYIEIPDIYRGEISRSDTFRYLQIKYRVVSGWATGAKMSATLTDGTTSTAAVDFAIANNTTTTIASFTLATGNTNKPNLRLQVSNINNMTIAIEYIRLSSRDTSNVSIGQTMPYKFNRIGESGGIHDNLVHWLPLNNSFENMTSPLTTINTSSVSPKPVTGITTMAYEFNTGTDIHWLEMNNNVPGTLVQNCTITFWYKMPSGITFSNGQVIMSGNIAASTAGMLRLNNNANGLELSIYVGGVTKTANIPAATRDTLINKWCHFTLIISDNAYSNNLQIIINGGDISSSTIAIGASFNNASQQGLVFMCENTSGASKAQGALDDIRIYNRVLNSTQIRNLYELTGGVPKLAMRITADGDILVRGQIKES